MHELRIRRAFAARFDPLAEGEECLPFLWVRLVTRYRTIDFPAPTALGTPCGGIDTISLEIGVGRCVDMDADIDWAVNAQEAEWGLDDSWRLDRVLCVVAGQLGDTAQIATEPILPYGPEGGGIIWSASLYIGITS